eukprot:5259569-Prymnesium_polylepis.1
MQGRRGALGDRLERGGLQAGAARLARLVRAAGGGGRAGGAGGGVAVHGGASPRWRSELGRGEVARVHRTPRRPGRTRRAVAGPGARHR